MDKLKPEDLKEFADMMNKSKVDRNGYIIMPDITGFKLYEISEERLKLYLEAENMYRIANKVKPRNKSVKGCDCSKTGWCSDCYESKKEFLIRNK